MKIENFKISIFSKIFRNFDFFDFHWLFKRKCFEHFSISKNNFRFLFANFFRRKNLDEKICSPIPIPNFPKIPKIALRKFSELSHTLWRSKRDFRVNLTFFWVALHIGGQSSILSSIIRQNVASTFPLKARSASIFSTLSICPGLTQYCLPPVLKTAIIVIVPKRLDL